jgi:hypothetical protein
VTARARQRRSWAGLWRRSANPYRLSAVSRRPGKHPRAFSVSGDPRRGTPWIPALSTVANRARPKVGHDLGWLSEARRRGGRGPRMVEPSAGQDRPNQAHVLLPSMRQSYQQKTTQIRHRSRIPAYARRALAAPRGQSDDRTRPLGRPSLRPHFHPAPHAMAQRLPLADRRQILVVVVVPLPFRAEGMALAEDGL